MKFLKQITTKVLILVFFINTNLWSKAAPESFADLAEELMPSVVNFQQLKLLKLKQIHFHFNFHQDLHLGKCLKNLIDLLKERQHR